MLSPRKLLNAVAGKATRRRQRESSRRGRSASRTRQVERLEDRVLLTTVTLTPSTNGGDGTWALEQRDGTDVYVPPAYLYFDVGNPVATFPGFQVGDSLHVEVNYYDEGSGIVRVQYDSTQNNFDETDFHTRSSRIDTQQFVTSHHYLENAEFNNGGNGHDFRIAAWGAPIASVRVSDEPFPGSGLEWAWAPPWEAPYTGASRPVDASTLSGKVMAGYQGWFNTPNDVADEGYVHWGTPGNWSIDQWPDPNDYDPSELFPVPGVTTAAGDQAYLFSSANDSVVDRHFEWMREHDIDGVLVQRFRESFMFKGPGGVYTGEPQWPVVNARDAAHRAGRTWAIEYDIQNGGSQAQRDQIIQEVKDDWEFLTDPDGMNMLADSHYQREDGKPVVAIFGMYVGPNNAYSTSQQRDLINYFQSRGVYVIGAGRHAEAMGQLANAALHDAYIPWQGYWKGGDSYAPDEAILDGVTTHIPHVFPGFSWTHLQDSDTATSVDREGGEFYWRMLADAVNETDAPWLFLGMFDEYDEATNLIPATDDPPVPDTDGQGDTLTYQVSDPRPNDWWMALSGAARQALQGKATITDTMPTEADLENRANTGGEARWTPDAESRLSNVPTNDSSIETVNVTVGGQVSVATRSTDPHLYFAIDDSFLAGVPYGRDLTIEVEYLDSLTGQFSLEYDGLDGAYENGGAALLTGSGEWRTHRFNVTDAVANNGQEAGADFRLTTPGGNLLVRRASVIKESVLVVEADLGPSDTADGLTNINFSGDGLSIAVTEDGRQARRLTDSATSRYLYLDVADSFAADVSAGLNAIVEVVYKDVGTGQLGIQYDSTGEAYKNTDAEQLTDSGEWRSARFYLDDAYFGGRQNGGADFRIVGSNISLDRVRVLRSFADLMEPEIAAMPPVVDSPNNTVSVTFAVTDDWATDAPDKWTPQEDNAVLVELTSDAGATWQPAATVYETVSVSASSSYHEPTGTHRWVDGWTLPTDTLATGDYQLRLTPIDGRGNAGDALVTDPFTVYAPPALPGDYNEDGVVNAADYTVWRDLGPASVTPYSPPDGNGDSVIDASDYAIWESAYGTSFATSVSLSREAGVVAEAPSLRTPDIDGAMAAFAGRGTPSNGLAIGSLFIDAVDDEPNAVPPLSDELLLLLGEGAEAYESTATERSMFEVSPGPDKPSEEVTPFDELGSSEF